MSTSASTFPALPASPFARPALRAQLLRFAGIGAVSTAAYLALFLALGAVLPGQAANAIALAVTAIGNTAANGRYTFGVPASQQGLRHHLHGLLVFAAALLATSVALAALHALAGEPSRAAEASVLVAASAASTAARFLALRGWVFRARSGEALGTVHGGSLRAGSGVLRGPEADPRWVRPGVLALLAGTAVLYLWGLGASGWANSFYSAAVQAGSTSWRAFFFGSFDASNFITVDKPPAALWVMDLSARVFGVNAWSILVPQALAGVGAVGLLYLTVRRRFGPGAGLIAGAVLALTPAAALMFRFNNPDALLVLLLVGSAYAMVRALERAQTRWLVLAGVLIGFAFLTKMLQAFLVVPGFALVYLLAAPTTLRRRLGQLAAGGLALIAAAGWWIAAVALTPASARPYIGGSQTNSVLELTLGYNGLGRLTGNETGSVGGGGGPGAGRWGATGLTRLFSAEMGGQVAWLLPAALILGAGALWLARRAPRTDGGRAQVLLWGSWLLVTGAVFSLAKGIIHSYYTVALAPAIGGLAGIGTVALWRHRHAVFARATLAGAVAVTAVWSFVLLARTPQWLPALRVLVLVGGLGAAAVLAGLTRLRGRQAVAVAVLAGAACLAGPAAYAVDTAATPHTGALPSAGPAAAANPGMGRPGLAAGQRGQFFGPGGAGQLPGPLAGQVPGQGGTGQAPGPFAGQVPGQGGAGGIGGLLDARTPSAALVTLLRSDAAGYRWAAATVGANSAAGVQLATGQPVLAVGGFNGTDPAPSLAQFQQLVREGKVHYFLAGGGFGGGPGGGAAGTSASSEISSWVAATYPARTVGGVTVYDLSGQAGSGSSAGTA